MHRAGSPQASFKSGSREMLLVSTGSEVAWLATIMVRENDSSQFL